MEIHARVALSLPNKFYKVELKYDTFEKATYDSYLVASLVKNAANEEEAIQYIDEITGNGSLNAHFKKLYKDISALMPEQIDGILRDSLYPVTVIDTNHHFKYYEMFDATRMDGKVYSGNLAEKEDFYKLIMPKDKDAKFLGIKFQSEEGNLKKDMYNAIFTDYGIKVELDGGKYCPITKEDFEEIFDEAVDMQSEWMPNIGTEITGGNWNVLTNDVMATWGKSPFTYHNEERNLVILNSDFVKITEVISVFGLLFYKETKYEFKKQYSKHITEAINFLQQSNNINNFKTKSLLLMLAVIDDIKAQEIVEWFLTRKDSKDVAEFGMKLICNGLEKGWSKPVLMSIKKFASPANYKYLYKINSDLGFEVVDFLDIDDTDLIEIHRLQKRAFVNEKAEMIKSIRSWVGEMLEVREKAKRLQKNNVVLAFNDFANKYIGHLKKDYEAMTFEQLKKEFDYVGSMYRGNYQKVKDSLKKAESEE